MRPFVIAVIAVLTSACWADFDALGKGSDASSGDVAVVDAPVDAAMDSADADTCIYGTIAFWKGDGTGFDFFGKENLSIVNGGAFTAAKVGMGFKPSPGYFKTSSSTASFGNLPQMTIEMWIQIPATSGSNRRVVRYGDAGVVWQLNIPASLGAIDFSVNNVGLASILNIPLGSFHHIAFTFDAPNGKMVGYLDGVVTNTTMPTGIIPAVPATLSLGSDASGSNLFDGLIDEVAIYRRVLSDQELKDIVKAGSSGRCRLQ